MIPTELPPAAVGSPGPGLDPFPPPPPHLGMEESGEASSCFVSALQARNGLFALF